MRRATLSDWQRYQDVLIDHHSGYEDCPDEEEDLFVEPDRFLTLWGKIIGERIDCIKAEGYRARMVEAAAELGRLVIARGERYVQAYRTPDYMESEASGIEHRDGLD